MGLTLVFTFFILSMITALITEHSLVWALLVGLFCFTALGMSNGSKFTDLAKAGARSVKDSFVVIEVMLVIGLVTASWRLSGTITVFVYYGMKLIIPETFLLMAFLLSCILSYVLGTSFGVAGTLGVIFMALARSGDVSPVITAGVLMSGIFFGDRCSPVSSSANLVAGVTKTDIYTNVKLMMKTGFLPLILTVIIYGILSFTHPIARLDTSILEAFAKEFTLSPWSFIPAVIMLILPLLRVNILRSITASIICSVLVSLLVERTDPLTIAKSLIFGYKAPSGGLSEILSGGGFVSMIEVILILVISCSYAGIFEESGIMSKLYASLESACNKHSRLLVTFTIGTLMSIVFCNQTIATLMCGTVLRDPYKKSGGSNTELAIDMENTLILLVALVPWAIACSVPLAIFGAAPSSLPWAVYLYLVPVCYAFTKRKFDL